MVLSLFIVVPYIQAAEPPPILDPYCFREDECRNPPYDGTPVENSSCRTQGAEWAQAGYLHKCYTQSRPIPLQVSIGGYEVVGLGNYMRRLFTFLVGISGITAGIMIIWAGIIWLTSAGNPEKINDARHKIGNALIGLMLILGSYLILQTINPALLNLEPLSLLQRRREGLPAAVTAKIPDCRGITSSSQCVAIEGCRWYADPGVCESYKILIDCNSIVMEETCRQHLRDGSCFWDPANSRCTAQGDAATQLTAHQNAPTKVIPFESCDQKACPPGQRCVNFEFVAGGSQKLCTSGSQGALCNLRADCQQPLLCLGQICNPDVGS